MWIIGEGNRSRGKSREVGKDKGMEKIRAEKRNWVQGRGREEMRRQSDVKNRRGEELRGSLWGFLMRLTE